MSMNRAQSAGSILSILAVMWLASCGGGGGGGGSTAPAPAPGPEVLYGADGAQGNLSNLYTLNPATGAVASTVGAIGFSVTGLAVHPTTRTLYGVTSLGDPGNPGFLITISKTTGAGALVGNLGPTIGDLVGDITFTSDGTLYGVAQSGDLVTINLATGAATSVANTTVPPFGAGIAASAGDVLFFSGQRDSGPLETVNRTTGVATTVATLNGGTNRSIGAMAFNQAGTLFGVRLNNSNPGGGPGNPATSELITINTTTAVITVVGASVNRLDAIVFD